MTTKSKILIAAAAVSTIAMGGIGAVAFADAKGDGFKRGLLDRSMNTVRSVEIPLTNATAIADCAFPMLDRNNDGLIEVRSRDQRPEQVTLEDMQVRTAERFARMDRNGDGIVDQADREIVQAKAIECMTLMGLGEQAAEMQAKMEARLADDDTSENAENSRTGRGNRGERRGNRMMGGLGGFNPLGRLLRGDADALNGLDQAGFQTFMAEKLTGMDGNEDGIVDGRELMQGMRAARQGS